MLRKLATDPSYCGVGVAVASTSLEPSYSSRCIERLEIVEDVAMKDVIDYAQIGRSGRLTSRKTSHFRLLREESKVPYEEMVGWTSH